MKWIIQGQPQNYLPSLSTESYIKLLLIFNITEKKTMINDLNESTSCDEHQSSPN